ncbi:dienelactone hydrolase family protein [soil metagenome]
MAVLSHEGTYAIMYGGFSVPVGAGYRPGYLARPDKVGAFPTVVVIPDLNGLTSAEKDLCRHLARTGLAALAIELYADPSDDPFANYASLSDRRAVTLLDEVHEFLASEDVDWAHAEALGLLGIDVGGRFALAMAANRPWVRAAAVCYTPLTGDEARETQVADLLDHLPVPILGLYGVDDEFIDTSTVDEAQRRNHSGQWLLYDGAGHGFLDLEADSYHVDSAADALQRLTQFFLQTLPVDESVDLG